VRTHRQLVVYHSILQVLHESGCPFCKFLKEYQTARLQNRSDVETRCLCNFHTWGLAAVQDAPAAAQAFIRILNEPASKTNGTPECDVCNEVRLELSPATEGRTGSIAQRAKSGSKWMGCAWAARRVSGFATRITSITEGRC
jgi:hypothetical protein